MTALNQTSPDFLTARKAMIDGQLRTSGVNDALVLERMNAVPREDYVPKAARSVAYIDRAVPLENGHRLGAPLFYGLALTLAQPDPQDKVLVVDAGSGYLPELMRPMVAEVEIISVQEAVAKSRKRGDFTLVLIDGAIAHVPDGLSRRMVENGRIVTGIVEAGVTSLATGQKSGAEITLTPRFEIGIPHLAEFDLPQRWAF